MLALKRRNERTNERTNVMKFLMKFFARLFFVAPLFLCTVPKKEEWVSACQGA